MYITKLNQNTDHDLQTLAISPPKFFYHQENLLNSRISKKNSFLSQRPIESERNGDDIQYSDDFKQMMNKVLNRICKKNNFLRIKKRQQFLSLNRDESPKQTDSQIYQSLTIENKIKKTANGFSKLKIEGIGRTQNDSNLLKKTNKPRIYNQTSVSFVKNKQFRKSIDMKKAKSVPSYGQIGNEPEREKQNQSFLNNLNRITFNNSFYPKVNEAKSLFDSNKAGAIIQKLQLQKDYQKMQEVFKKELEPKHKKIDLAKKLYHKKMVERQRNNEKNSESFISKPKIKIVMMQKDEPRHEFEPWNTSQDISEDMLKIYKRYPD